MGKASQRPACLQQSDKSVPLQWLIRLPALSIMVVLRPDVGLRLLTYGGLFGIAFGLSLAACFIEPQARPDDLALFGKVVLVSGLISRFRRWREFRRGVCQHSFYIGTSCFAKWRWPAFMLRHRRIEKYVDPAVAMFLGWLLIPYTESLAVWLVYAGLCLAICDDVVHRATVRRELDIADGLVMSTVQGESAERFANSPASGQAQGPRVVPTGLADDIRDRIRERSKR